MRLNKRDPGEGSVGLIVSTRDDMVIKGLIGLEVAFVCSGMVFRESNMSIAVNWIYPLSLLVSTCFLVAAVALNYYYNDFMTLNYQDDIDVTYIAIRTIQWNAFCGIGTPLLTLCIGILLSVLVLLDDDEQPKDFNSLLLPISFGYAQMFALIVGVSCHWKGIKAKYPPFQNLSWYS
ncbi:hypothetical protein TRICI_001068 [Trichomonascus ciferrii]|uniref:Uncharacterized protein n=1 Tax=Trichomonascus ciferrii TaxID=44093 RepID=A0A642V9F5_9ASCO|nr:hypothetical protein TRICI_001068 [Trichomonascus ciferrii]